MSLQKPENSIGQKQGKKGASSALFLVFKIAEQV